MSAVSRLAEKTDPHYGCFPNGFCSLDSKIHNYKKEMFSILSPLFAAFHIKQCVFEPPAKTSALLDLSNENMLNMEQFLKKKKHPLHYILNTSRTI